MGMITEESRRAKDKLERERTQRNSASRLKASGVDVLGSIKAGASALGGAVSKGLDFIDKPRNAVMTSSNQLGKNLNTNLNDNGSVLQAARDGFTQKKRTYGSDVMKQLGVDSKAGQFAGGLALDVASDPLSYMTFGAGSFMKGAMTGTRSTIGREAIEAAGRKAAAESGRVARRDILKQHGAVNIDELAKRIGGTKDDAYNMINKKAYGSHFDDAQKAMPNAKSYEVYTAASKAFANKAGRNYSESQLRMAGKGATVLGKTVRSGSAMQDAGAALSDKLAKAPIIGNTIDSARARIAPAFSTKPASGVGLGIDAQQAAVLKSIGKQSDGKKALMDLATEQTAKNLAALSRGLTFKGVPIDEAIDTIIAKNGDGITKADLSTVITTDAKKKFAARQLAANQNKTAGHIADPDNMTLGQLLNVYARLYKSQAIDESREGMLSLADPNRWRGVDLAGDLSAGKTVSDQYLPRVRSAADKAFRARGGRNGSLKVTNVYAKMRKDAYDGMSVSEINDTVRQSGWAQGMGMKDDAQFLEESQIRAYVSRQLSSNKMLADKEFVDNVLSTFGERLRGDISPAEVEAYRQQGMAIVAPKQAFNLMTFKDDVVKQLAESFDAKAGRNVTKTESSAKILNDLTSEDAMNLLVSSNGRTPVYAIPLGAMEYVNKTAARQIDEGIKQMHSLMGRFYKVWKPMVTGMRLGYHARNIVSSEFNNFVTLGTDMVSADVQKMSAAVALYGRGTNHIVDPMMQKVKNVSVTINGKQWTAEQIHKAMVESGALNTFMLTDSSTLSQSIMNDVGDAMSGGIFQRALSSLWPTELVPNVLKAWVGTGKMVGNTVEEFVRTTNFVAQLKRGLSPQEAAEMVNKAHFDYQDLTEFEQTVKSNAMPFYTWLRKNLPLQFESLLNDPRIYQTLNRATQEGSNVYDIDYAMIPQYIRENYGIPLGYNEEGRLRIINPGLPVGDLSTGWKDIVTGMGPIVKAAVELTTNQNLLTGAPLDRTGYDYSIKLLNNQFGGAAAPQWVKDFVFSPTGAGLVKFLSYSKGNMGVFRDVGETGKIAAEAPETQVIQQGRNYSHAKTDTARKFLSQLDPNFTQYYSPSAAQRSLEYDKQAQLDNTIQAMKKLGIPIRTMDEIRP